MAGDHSRPMTPGVDPPPRPNVGSGTGRHVHSNSGTVKDSLSQPRIAVQEYARGAEPGCGGPTGEVHAKPFVLNCGPAGTAANAPARITTAALAQEVPLTRRRSNATRARWPPIGTVAWTAWHAVVWTGPTTAVRTLSQTGSRGSPQPTALERMQLSRKPQAPPYLSRCPLSRRAHGRRLRGHRHLDDRRVAAQGPIRMLSRQSSLNSRSWAAHCAPQAHRADRGFSGAASHCKRVHVVNRSESARRSRALSPAASQAGSIQAS